MIIVIGGGIYGLYSALYLGKRTDNIVQILEYENRAINRASWINQARVHMGYHYPRSITTAMKSAEYFKRFVDDYYFCIHKNFKQIYAMSKDFSWTNACDFERFCNSIGIKCELVDSNKYFKNQMCDGAFLTEEYTYDAQILRDYLLNEIDKFKNIKIEYGVRIANVKKEGVYVLETNKGVYYSDYVINATYASTNQISNLFGESLFNVKYELCEIILCDVNDKMKEIGITVMDGPFFSIMPFGKTGLHSLTSVVFTPHLTSSEIFPEFECMNSMNGVKGYCCREQLGNCNECSNKPLTAWHYMSKLAQKYVRDDYCFSYNKSLFSIKPVLLASEIDDSRPTVIQTNSGSPKFISILSGKINTIYAIDMILDEVITNE